ncbi:hypothetical protein V1282_004600 [Nitrobacteraceae bacterium AZCC 2146]
MTMNIDAGRRLVRGRPAISDMSSRLHWLALAAVFAVAILLRHVVAANTDVSWLLIVGERVLDGQRLYADILETNPPMAVLVYIPGIALARALGLRPELVTDGLIFLMAAVSLGATARILQRAAVTNGMRCWPLALLAAAVLTILPMHVFGQREHIALLTLLPALAVYVLRGQRESVPLWAMVIAGLGASVTLTFKPYFVFAVGFCIVAAALRARSWRVLFAPENFLAAALVAIYGALIFVFYPDYFTVIYPLVRDIYLPLTVSWSVLLGNDATTLWLFAGVAILVLRLRRKADSALVVLLAASTGFAVAFYLQRKGWAYQSYPMLALVLLALGYAVASHPVATSRDRRFGLGGLLVLAATLAGGCLWFNATFNVREIDGPVASLGPHPKILMLSGEAVIGHPLVRTLGGTWVSRQQGLWVREFVRRLRQNGPLDASTETRLDAHLAREHAGLIEDFKKQPPDVVLIDNLSSNWGAWVRADPELTALLKPYTLFRSVRDIDILRRAGP